MPSRNGFVSVSLAILQFWKRSLIIFSPPLLTSRQSCTISVSALSETFAGFLVAMSSLYASLKKEPITFYMSAGKRPSEGFGISRKSL